MKTTCPHCSRRIKIRKGKRDIRCSCGGKIPYTPNFGNPTTYLVDANVFFFVANKNARHSESCRGVLYGGTKTATTDKIVEELSPFTVGDMPVYVVSEISPVVDELRYYRKELSIADKSLIQASLDHPEVAGIITYDADIKSVYPVAVIGAEKFFIGTAEEFLKKVKK